MADKTAIVSEGPATEPRAGDAGAQTGINKQGAIADLARQLLDLDEGELSSREKAVIQRAAHRLSIARDVGLEFNDRTFGQRLADKVATIGGSWPFLIAFFIVLGVWTTINGVVLATHAFDPYPFILLNLVLSVLASIQGPIILMSQNRAAARDRLMAQHDYEVNLKAEIEIAALHEKLDEIRQQELATLVGRIETAVSTLAHR